MTSPLPVPPSSPQQNAQTQNVGFDRVIIDDVLLSLGEEDIPSNDVLQQLVEDIGIFDGTDLSLFPDIAQLWNEQPQMEVQQPQMDVQQLQMEIQQPQLDLQQPQTEVQMDVQQPQPEVQQPQTEIQMDVQQPQPKAQQPQMNVQMEIQQPQLDLHQPQMDVQQSQLEVHQPQMEQPQMEVQQPQLEVQQPQLDLHQPQMDVQQSQLDLHQSQMNVQQSQLDLHQPQMEQPQMEQRSEPILIDISEDDETSSEEEEGQRLPSQVICSSEPLSAEKSATQTINLKKCLNCVQWAPPLHLPLALILYKATCQVVGNVCDFCGNVFQGETRPETVYVDTRQRHRLKSPEVQCLLCPTKGALILKGSLRRHLQFVHNTSVRPM